VSITSMLHWRNPQPGRSCWRMLDMVVVHVSLAIHLCAMWAAGASAAFSVMVVALGCFGWSLWHRSYVHHAAGWATACMSNVLLTYARSGRD
jgi:hypothetical protein